MEVRDQDVPTGALPQPGAWTGCIGLGQFCAKEMLLSNIYQPGRHLSLQLFFLQAQELLLEVCNSGLQPYLWLWGALAGLCPCHPSLAVS